MVSGSAGGGPRRNMSGSKTSAINLAHGLSLLMMHVKCHYFNHFDECGDYINPRSIHPFGLTLPHRGNYEPAVRIDFVGAHATDISVEVFLANIRFWVGYSEGTTIHKLRVISMPFVGGERGQNHVFFETWLNKHTIISGETTDFSGAGDTARRDLEDVFAVLSLTHKVEIDRVQLDKAIPLRELYAEETT